MSVKCEVCGSAKTRTLFIESTEIKEVDFKYKRVTTETVKCSRCGTVRTVTHTTDVNPGLP